MIKCGHTKDVDVIRKVSQFSTELKSLVQSHDLQFLRAQPENWSN